LLNEIRKDYLLDRWVVVATHRKHRPTDFKKKASSRSAEKKSCPFCPGNERKTPPAVLVYLRGEGDEILRKKDTDGVRQKDWLIRCVPNLYPAFSPPEDGESFELGKAVGHHEVLIESPNHDEHPGVARPSQLVHVVGGYVDRLKALSLAPYVKYVSIFRNHGLEAGASLSHAHSQIIATPTVPTTLADELKASQDFYSKHGVCFFCDLLEKERDSARSIWANRSFEVLAPWAAVHPFEFWVVPKAHQASIKGLKREDTQDLAQALNVCLGGLKRLLNDPPYNYGLHLAPDDKVDQRDFYHWHLEVYPKLTTWAGFEKSTGIFINVMPPEDSAQSLKNAIEGPST
jgi:UDPglucose--hexose-1-phosphate uridylyltransferase